MIELTDESLLIRYGAGDILKFDILYRRHKDVVYRYITGLTKNPDTAAELTQLVWEKVIRNAGSLVDKIRDPNVQFVFKPFLFTIAMNTVRDHYRLAHTRHANQMNVTELDGTRSSEIVIDDITLEPEKKLHLDELRGCIDRGLDNVTESFRNTFEITRDNYLSYAEAAIVMSVSTETVKSRVKTVLKKIKPCLELSRA